MLQRLSLRDFVIVDELELDLHAGFTALTGETGAGKSILIDALQLVLGGRGDAGVVREGCPRTEISAVFDQAAPLSLWLETAGFTPDDELLLRRVIDHQGKSRAWINGSPATVAQLKELGEQLVDIHGQHAWQSLTRPDAVRQLLDSHAGIDPAPLQAAWARWRAQAQHLERARAQQDQLQSERERLQWQIGELDKLGPQADEWDELEAEHKRLSNVQSLLDGSQQALSALSEPEDDRGGSALDQVTMALERVQALVEVDASLQSVCDTLVAVQDQLQDAAHALSSYVRHAELDPDRLAEVDERMGLWVSLARRYRREPQALPQLLAEWRAQLAEADAASDLDGLERSEREAFQAYQHEARQVSRRRHEAAPRLSSEVTQAMQELGMSGGRFEVALLPLDVPQASGLEQVELRVAGHAGATPRAMAKVASGGELSRIALALAVCTSQQTQASTLIFDEIDSGVGGVVAQTVGRMMRQLGGRAQVLAVTHLPQVAAWAHQHFVVSKRPVKGATVSDIRPVEDESRVREVARMMGDAQGTPAGLNHAQELLQQAIDGAAAPTTRAPRKTPSKSKT
ncbi:MAG: DNA repair protein RecN [Burkholderiaceae bacterium]|nr:MAG: DNA repair protein RecN [Burkholderiaceae bacterium]